MNWNKRKEEILNAWNDETRGLKLVDFINILIEQEKIMIREFANDTKNILIDIFLEQITFDKDYSNEEIEEIYINNLNKLLKDMEINEI